MPFTLKATILGVTIDPEEVTIPTATIGTPVNQSFDAVNEFAGFTGGAVDTTLASAQDRHSEHRSPRGAAQRGHAADWGQLFRATIGSPGDPGADLDLFVYDCADPTDNPTTLAGCNNRGQSADGDSEESVTVNPALLRAGRGRRGRRLRCAGRVHDVRLHRRVHGHDAAGYDRCERHERASRDGFEWLRRGHHGQHGTRWGRVLYGHVEVRTSDGVLVGRSQVVIESVAP